MSNLTDDEYLNYKKRSMFCLRKLKSIHESTGVFYTSKERLNMNIEGDYGGITGSIVLSDFNRIIKILFNGITVTTSEEEDSKEMKSVLEDEYLFKKNSSVFLDVGCGNGSPVFLIAGLELKCSIGFDISNDQVLNSIQGFNMLKNNNLEFKSPVSLFKKNVYDINSLSPVTHLYSFLGDSLIAFQIAKLVLNSPELKVICLVVVKKDCLSDSGLIFDTKNHYVLKGIKMFGGGSYTGVIIKVNDALKENIQLKLKEKGDGELQPSLFNFNEFLEGKIINPVCSTRQIRSCVLKRYKQG